MAATRRVAAVDLGATSGRIMVAEVGDDTLELTLVHRFPNGPVRAADGSLHWDIRQIYREILAGLRQAGPVDSIGVDSWAVDYGLLDADGVLLADPYCYRDDRTRAGRAHVSSMVSDADLFAVSGLQQQAFNTIYQLASEPDLSEAVAMLLIPDLIGYWLTGAIGAEVTNASTTQLFDVRRRVWAVDLAEKVGIPASLLPALREPGSRIGVLRAEVAERAGQSAGTPVIAVGSHDTASAVVGVPAVESSHYAYVSSGTWSLVGVELAAPVLSAAAQAANFTNEGGVDRTTRFLRNVMGLWVLSETLRVWSLDGPDDLDGLLAAAAGVPAGGPVVDLDQDEFLPPGDMPARIAAACQAAGLQAPVSRAQIVRCILDSLADAYRRAVQLASTLSGQPVEVVHVVGGGVQNALLCQLAADAVGVPVLAGPVEAAALGNVLVQARALGADLPDLAAMRSLVARTHVVRRYDPRPRQT